MISTLKHFPGALWEELKKQFPVVSVAKKALQGELISPEMYGSGTDQFKAGFLNSIGVEMGDKPSPAGATVKPDDKERGKAFALGMIAGSALRSLGAIGSFWLLFNGIQIGAGGVVGSVGEALKHGSSLDSLKALGSGLLSTATHPSNLGPLWGGLAAGSSFLNMSDSAFQSAAGAVNGSKKSMLEGKYGFLQALGIAAAALSGMPAVPVAFSLAMMIAKAGKLAKLRAEEEKAAKG